jgi:hypothetical protein
VVRFAGLTKPNYKPTTGGKCIGSPAIAGSALSLASLSEKPI